MIMNRLDPEKRAQIVRALVEGNSLRAVERMTGANRETVTNLLVDLGRACAEYQDKTLQNLNCKRIQCDEIWAYVGAKDKNLPDEKKDKFGWGSVWTWTAIDADTKLIASWMVGTRDGQAAKEFMDDLAGRLANRVQLTTDGHGAYLEAVEFAFGNDIDYAQLIKLYGEPADPEKRYSPAQCIGIETKVRTGAPDHKHISTSYVERQNLTMRMCMRRFTRLTNGFSKKVENHIAAVSVHLMYYNFARIHQTLRVTPAMAAGVAEKVWEVSDMINLLIAWEVRQQKELEAQRMAAFCGGAGPSALKLGRKR